MLMLVSIHAESTGVTGVFEVRPVPEGSGGDVDPCQRQLLGPSVLANKRGASSPARLLHRLPSLHSVLGRRELEKRQQQMQQQQLSAHEKRRAPQPTPNRCIESSSASRTTISIARHYYLARIILAWVIVRLTRAALRTRWEI